MKSKLSMYIRKTISLILLWSALTPSAYAEGLPTNSPLAQSIGSFFSIFGIFQFDGGFEFPESLIMYLLGGEVDPQLRIETIDVASDSRSANTFRAILYTSGESAAQKDAKNYLGIYVKEEAPDAPWKTVCFDEALAQWPDFLQDRTDALVALNYSSKRRKLDILHYWDEYRETQGIFPKISDHVIRFDDNWQARFYGYVRVWGLDSTGNAYLAQLYEEDGNLRFLQEEYDYASNKSIRTIADDIVCAMDDERLPEGIDWDAYHRIFDEAYERFGCMEERLMP